MTDCGLNIYLFIFQKSELSWCSRYHVLGGSVIAAFFEDMDGC